MSSASFVKFVRRLPSALLILCLLLTLLPPTLSASAAPIGDNWIDYRAEEYSDADGGYLTIHSAEELALFAYECATGTGERYYTVRLANDISLYGHYWAPINADSWTNFDGCGYTISGMTIAAEIDVPEEGFDYGIESELSYGLFNTVGSVQNLTMRNASIDITIAGSNSNTAYCPVYCGAIAAGIEDDIINCSASVNINVDATDTFAYIHIGGLTTGAGKAENCHVSGSINLTGGHDVSYVGGVLTSCSRAIDCTNRVNITCTNAAEAKIGGVVALSQGSEYDEEPCADHCVNYGTITLIGTDEYYGSLYAGGVGYSLTGTAYQCRNEGSILIPNLSEYTYYVGGIYAETHGTIKNCFHNGVINCSPDAASVWAGGIVGVVQEYGVVTDCLPTGTVSAFNAGGIAGKNHGEVYSCRSNGTVTGVSAGGIVSENRGTIEACENYGEVSTIELSDRLQAAGGIVGQNYETVLACRNNGSVSSAYAAGGIVGRDELGLISSCVNSGTVLGKSEDTEGSPKAGGIVGVLDGTLPYDTDRLGGSVENCENVSLVQSFGGSAGGIAGLIDTVWDPVLVYRCKNSGTVQTFAGQFGGEAGGIVGTMRTQGSFYDVRQCSNTGYITSESSAGGIVGDAVCFISDETAYIRIFEVFNGGFVQGEENVGGLISALSEGIELYNALNIGTVSGPNPPANYSFTGSLIGNCRFGNPGPGLYSQEFPDVQAVGTSGKWWGNDYPEDHSDNVLTLSRGQMSDPANFPEFDFENVWKMDGTPVLRMTGLDSAETSTKSYYYSITDKLFRFVATDAGYPQPGGFTVTLDQAPYSTGGSTDVGIPIPGDFSGTILCSKEGYHSYELPRSLLTSYNVITMTPDSVETPFVAALLADTSDPGYKSYRNLRAEGLTVYEAGLNAKDISTERIYVSVNWNGHGVGDVWLRQGEKVLYLSDSGFTELQLGLHFDAGRTVYVCGEAEDGTTFSHATKIQVLTKPINPSISLGNSFSAAVDSDSTDSQMSFLNKQSFELDGAFSDGLVPIKIKISSDGTVKGTIGLTLAKTKTSLTGKPGETAEWEHDTLFSRVQEYVDLCNQGPAAKDKADKKLKELQAKADMPTVPASVGISGSAQVVGYFVGDMSSGSFEFTECSIVMIFGGKVVCTVPYTAWGIPGFIQTELAAKLEVILSDWKYDCGGDVIIKSGNTGLSLEASVAATYAVGVDGGLSLGAKGKGSVTLETVVPFAKDKTNMYLQGSISLVGTALGMTGEWTVFETDKQYFLYHGELCWRKGAQLNAIRPIAFMDSPAGTVNLNSYAEPLSEDSLQTNIYPSGQTAFAVMNGSTALLVWQGNSESGSPVLYYSCGDGYSWTDPQLIDTDGTTDFNPILKCVNGSIYLLYNDLDETAAVPADDYSAIPYATQISVMRFEGYPGFTDLGTVGIENALDLQPDIYEQAGALVLSWQSIIPGTEGAAQMVSTLTDSGWSAPQSAETPIWYDPTPIPDNAPVSGAACYDVYESVGILFYAEGDRIFATFRDGTGWGTPIELLVLPEDTEVCSLSAGHDDYHNLYVAASCVAPSGQTDLLVYTIEDLPQDIAVIDAGYISDSLIPGSLFPDQDSELTAWIEVQNNTPHTLRSLCVDIFGADDIWDARVIEANIPSGATQTIYFDFTLPETAADIEDSYTFSVFSEEFYEPDTSNNSAVCTIRKADLSVEDLYAIAHESSGEATVWIVNRGMTDVSGATVQLFSLTDPSNPLTEAQTVSLDVGAATSVSFTGIDFTGETQITAVVSGVAEENITANNSFIATVQFYDPGKLSAKILRTTRIDDWIEVSFSAENTTNAEKDCILVIASYSNGQMLDVAFLSDLSVAGENEWLSTVVLDAPADRPVEVKLFLLSADGTFTPLQLNEEGQSV